MIEKERKGMRLYKLKFTCLTLFPRTIVVRVVLCDLIILLHTINVYIFVASGFVLLLKDRRILGRILNL